MPVEPGIIKVNGADHTGEVGTFDVYEMIGRPDEVEQVHQVVPSVIN
jgi:hypothetical protein